MGVRPFGVERFPDAVPQAGLAGRADRVHPGQCFPGVDAFVGGERVDGGAQDAGDRLVKAAEPADGGGEPDIEPWECRLY
ncbi:hypothetical protein ACFVU3_32015 [Streptomyces sp. NPDC058052]|uniref:hypothetical protein n=1 Tax=Streptomyces sp. NPDC058052 TaxID=3346316 RepID=UPI0036E2A7F9